jgi:hypothetical protein
MTIEHLANGAPLGPLTFQSDVAGTKVEFPVELSLSLSTSPLGVHLTVLADIGFSNLQAQFDAIAKSLPMPNDTSGYGTKTVAKVTGASLSASGDTAVVAATVDVEIWQIEKGLPGGITVRTRRECVDLGPLGKACVDIPERVEFPPGPDIKLKLLSEGLSAQVALSLATPDGVSVEVRPGSASVTPRGDVGRFFNDIARIFNEDLSSKVQAELKEIVSDGTLRQALPTEIREYNPKIAAVQFATRSDGSLGAKVQFEALLTPDQLTAWLQKAIQQ